MQTTTTTYQYNADGALTAVTTQVDTQPATTTYLTWANFLPDAGQPTTGTVSAADGNLLGIGPRPGTTGLTTQFVFDSRDRLTSCAPAGQSAVSYAYDPASRMASSTLTSGDALQFYYDHAATPLMVNTRQPSTGLVSSFLGTVRYLSDGTEQVLLKPRKDVGGVYDAAAETLSPYGYDPYGAPLSPAAPAGSGLSGDGTSYDLISNPFQYAGEYQDPSCDAYYLRARWYLPAQHTFLSRDPADPLHRYSYTGGNPIGRTDPTGLRHTGDGFARDVNKAVHKLEPGIAAYIEPVLPIWGDVMGGIELVGLIASFWHHPTAEGMISFGFLAASIIAESAGEFSWFDRQFGTARRAMAGRIALFDLPLGVTQTFAQSYRHRRLDVPTLIQGIDATAFGIFYGRALMGWGYRPYDMTADDVLGVALKRLPAGDDLLIFRARRPAIDSFGYRLPYMNTSPLLEDLHLGVYHEELIGFSRSAILRTHLTVDDDGDAFITADEIDHLEPMQYQYVGSVPANPGNAAAMKSSPLGVPISGLNRDSFHSVTSSELDQQRYRVFGRNCQNHAALVRKQLGL
jgi:RHS repeat-associated protein